MRALVDGDLLMWRAGASAQKKVYVVEGQDYIYLSEAKEYADAEGVSWDDIAEYVIPGLIEHALHNAKVVLENIFEQDWCDDHVLYFSNPVYQFRKAEIPTYKANRTMDKPVHWEDIRTYLDSYYNTEDAGEGYEADDWLGIHQTNDTVICTMDKDLDMVPGWHYNWNTKKLYYVSPSEGFRFFLRQMITGDTVDNIQGIPDAGKEFASQYMNGKSNEKCLKDIFDLYEAEFGGEGALQFYLTARQLWIHRK